MSQEIPYMILCSTILLSLFILDYHIGNGFVNMAQMLMCSIYCFVKTSMPVALTMTDDTHDIFNFPVLIIEGTAFFITHLVLKHYKFSYDNIRLDNLINESKESLRITEEFLEKWRLRRVLKKTSYSYLDEEPQQIKPFKLEEPILHMAVIDTRSHRKQQKREDAGDLIEDTDSPTLSFVSLIDNEFDLNEEGWQEDLERNDYWKNHDLWVVEEEGPDVNSSTFCGKAGT